MSPPRGVFAEVDLFITRRVWGRQTRLRPSRTTNRIVRYLVAVFARKYDISIHAICVLGNHWHLVIHDWFGNFVPFIRDCHSFITRAINDAHGDEGAMWDAEQTSKVRPVAPSDTIARIAYTMANPVKHGLVKHGKSWPGARHAWPARPRTIKRPPNFFRAIEDDGSWPETIELVMTRPLGYEHLSDDQLAALIREAIEAAEESFRAARAEAGQGFIGRRNVRRRSRYQFPKKQARQRRRKPTVACADPERKKQELEKDRDWRARYADRLRRWCAGERDVVFPHGTYKMRVLHGVAVEPAPP